MIISMLCYMDIDIHIHIYINSHYIMDQQSVLLNWQKYSHRIEQEEGQGQEQEQEKEEMEIPYYYNYELN